MTDSTTADLVRDSLPAERRNQPDAVALAQLFTTAVDATDPIERMDAWVEMLLWSRIGHDADRTKTGVLIDTSRFRMLIGLIEQSPGLEVRFSASFAALLAATNGTALFAETGIPGNRGFIAEAGERLANRILPEPHDPTDLGQLVRRLYPDRLAVDRLRGQGPGPLHRAAMVLVSALPSEAWQPLRRALIDGMRLLLVRVLAQGLAPNVRLRSHELPPDQSPFHLLHQAGEALLASLAKSDLAHAESRWRQAVAAVFEELQEIRRQIEVEGVSVDVVYGIEVIRACIVRMELIVAILVKAPSEERSAAIHALLTDLVEGCQRDRSLSHLTSSSLRLLHQKIVERSGRTGEHYVALSRKEYFGIWLAAAGGGVLTVFTAAIKTLVTMLHIAPFAIGLLSSVNYAASFMILHHCHLILATKQPAMTAATLAGIVREKRGTERLDEIVDFTAAIVSSQIAATIANIIVVAVGAFAFDTIWEMSTGHHWLTAAKAQHTYDDFSPVNSLTIWYAAITGVFLWLSSLIGGWFANWSAYHRVPQGLRDLRRRGMVRPFAKFGDLTEQNIAGWATNISLGFILGMAPVFGSFLGLPIDVRHVTLNTGILSLAASGLDDGWFNQGKFLLAVSGIAVMFVLNLGVSFSLSLFTALRAYELPRHEVIDLLKRLLKRVVRRPLDFFFPIHQAQSHE